MANRVKGFVVVLEEDISEEQAERISAAIYQMRSVLKVESVETNFSDYMDRERIRHEFFTALIDVVKTT